MIVHLYTVTKNSSIALISIPVNSIPKIAKLLGIKYDKTTNINKLLADYLKHEIDKI